MKIEKLKIILPIIIVIVAIMVIVVYIWANQNNEETEMQEVNIIANIDDTEEIENEVETIIVELNEMEEENVIEEEAETKTPAQLTQEIYDINGKIGTLEIPSTGLKTQILSNVTVENMEKAPCFLYTTGGLNKVGVTLIVGHNYQNGTLFSNNKNIKVNDEIYFTDLDGNTLTYVVYDTLTTTDDDTSFLKSDVTSPELVLSCCTDEDDNVRIIILARAE